MNEKTQKQRQSFESVGEKDVHKTFGKVTEKHRCWNLSLTGSQVPGRCRSLLKRDSSADVLVFM